MQAILMELGAADVRAYFVWGPFLKADTEQAARQSMERVAAPNSVHFWLPSQKLSWEAASELQLPLGRSAWDVYLLYQRGTIWDRTFPVPSYWQQPLDLLQGDRYDPQVLRGRILEALNQRT